MSTRLRPRFAWITFRNINIRIVKTWREVFERSREVGNLLVILLWAGLLSHSDNAICNNWTSTKRPGSVNEARQNSIETSSLAIPLEIWKFRLRYYKIETRLILLDKHTSDRQDSVFWTCYPQWNFQRIKAGTLTFSLCIHWKSCDKRIINIWL